MSKYIVTLILLLYSFSVNSQNILKGVFVDTETLEIVPYSTIHLRNTFLGTMANANGKFKIVIPDSILTNSELVISSMGFETLNMKIFEIKDTIYLQKKINALPEVIVHHRQTENISLGVSKKSQRTGSFGTCNQINLQAALYIPNNNQIKGRVKSISYYIDKKQGIAETPFRMRIYSKDISTNYPQNDLLNKVIIISGKENGGWITVNIDSLGIEFPNTGLFVGTEWLYDYKKYHYSIQYITKSDTLIKNCFGQCIGITNNISEHRTWIRDLFNYEWRLRDWSYSDPNKKKPNNIMIRVEIEYYE